MTNGENNLNFRFVAGSTASEAGGTVADHPLQFATERHHLAASNRFGKIEVYFNLKLQMIQATSDF